MSEDHPGPSKDTLSGCPSPARVDSSSSLQSDVPVVSDLDSWVASNFLLGHLGQRRPSSWDDSEEEFSPRPWDGSETHRIYSGCSNDDPEDLASEIRELDQEFLQSLERNSNHGDLQNDRRRSPARIRRRTRSSSSSSPVLEPTKQSNEEKNFEEETENKILELDSKFYLNNFFTELRSRRISLFDSGSIDDAPQDSSDPADDVFCPTSRKLSQILEVEECRRDPERNPEENSSGRSRKGEVPEEGRREYKSLSFEGLGGRGSRSRGSLTERCDRILRQIDGRGVFLSARAGRSQSASPRWGDTEGFHFLERLKSDLFASDRLDPKGGCGRDSESSLTEAADASPGLKSASSSESACGKSSASRDADRVASGCPSGRSPRVEPLAIPGTASNSNRSGSTTRSRKTPATRSHRASEEKTPRKSLDRGAPSTPRSADQEEKSHSGRAEETSDGTEEQSPEEADRVSSRSRTSTGRESSKRLSVINEVSFEDVEISRLDLEEDSSSAEEETGGRSRREDGRWEEILEAFDDNRDSPCSWSRAPAPPPANKAPDAPEAGTENLRVDSVAPSGRQPAAETKLPSSRKESSGQRLQKERPEEDAPHPEERPADKLRTTEESPVRHSNAFFIDVCQGTPFGIGEFGDVTCWDVGKSDRPESEGPKDHGDGLCVGNADREAFSLAHDRKEKGSKVQRQLWTELKEDFREVKCPVGDDTFFFPDGLKASRSDNCIAAAADERRSDRGSRKRKRGASSTRSSRSTAEDSGSESKEEEDFQFAREAAGRLTSSMSNINVRSRSRDDVDDPTTYFFATPREETDAREEDETTSPTRGRNWLTLGNPKGRRLRRKKPEGDSGEFVYGRATAPRLKPKNSNCFQNFYKRVISAFCVTSASSAATSQ